ncbi:hypothetical protein CMV30_02020 [Nibricoccus aquaticus]|uniref:Uncharacterized protein n=1 Tax=Nibricoccus aquaticus TaxID=2576891 RepID=A0A290Q9B9_9BACT|nr:tetratricopeptide repeat protein [Nibricoccus aquaticus]ATC62836.1 hypothetical protein CMV30_02020 [Nibricoccus aquaticus]
MSPPPALPPPLPSERRRSLFIQLSLVALAAIALGIFATVTTADTRRTQRLTRQLMALSDQGKFREGLALAEKELPHTKPNAALYFAMENLHFGVDDLAQTKLFGGKTLELNPDNEMAARMIMIVCRKYEDYAHGIDVGRAWIAANTHGTSIYKDLALICDDAGRDTEAFTFAAEGFRRAPSHARIASIYFYYAFEANGVEPTLREVESWTARYTPEAFFWAQVGKGLSDAGSWEEALPRLELALKMGSDDESVLTEILDCYRSLKATDRATAFVEKLQKTREPGSAIWRNLGAIYYDAGEFEKALTTSQKARDLDPKNAITTANILFTLYELKRSQEAFDLGQQWLATSGHVPTATLQRSIGHVAFALNRWPEAEHHYRASLSLAPDNVNSARDLISTLVEAKRIGEAVSFGMTWREAHPKISDTSFDLSLAKAREKAAEANTP